MCAEFGHDRPLVVNIVICSESQICRRCQAGGDILIHIHRFAEVNIAFELMFNLAAIPNPKARIVGILIHGSQGITDIQSIAVEFGMVFLRAYSVHGNLGIREFGTHILHLESRPQRQFAKRPISNHRRGGQRLDVRLGTMEAAGPVIIISRYHTERRIQRKSRRPFVVNLMRNIKIRRYGRMHNISGIAGFGMSGHQIVGTGGFGFGTRSNPSTADGHFGTGMPRQPAGLKYE